jgi:hypothetical protein
MYMYMHMYMSMQASKALNGHFAIVIGKGNSEGRLAVKLGPDIDTSTLPMTMAAGRTVSVKAGNLQPSSPLERTRAELQQPQAKRFGDEALVQMGLQLLKAKEEGQPTNASDHEFTDPLTAEALRSSTQRSALASLRRVSEVHHGFESRLLPARSP